MLGSEGLITDLEEYSTVLAGPKERGHVPREKIRKVVRLGLRACSIKLDTGPISILTQLLLVSLRL